MSEVKQQIYNRLKTDILPLEGLRAIRSGNDSDLGLGVINHSFPQGSLPLGAMHEFISYGPEAHSASAGFISGILGALMKNNHAAVWIGSGSTVFPPALQQFGIRPENILFIDLKKEKEILWVMEESLKCDGLTAVIGEIPEISFTNSRRFQLTVEQSRVTGFLIRSNPRALSVNACVSRWKINSQPSESYQGLPGPGFPRWKIDLLKIRNGKPGSWLMEWRANQFRIIHEQQPSILLQPKRKTG